MLRPEGTRRVSALAAMRRLERLAAHLLRGEPLPPGDAVAIGQAIEQWLADGDAFAVRSLYERLGLALAAGEHDPRKARREERRDALLVAALQLMRGESGTARARELYQRLRTYFDGPRWRIDRLAARCPYGAGMFEALVWEALMLDPRVLSAERLRRLLGELVTKSPLSVPRCVSEEVGA